MGVRMVGFDAGLTGTKLGFYRRTAQELPSPSADEPNSARAVGRDPMTK
jgi:hypothetical protein